MKWFKMAHCIRCNSILNDYEIIICNDCIKEEKGEKNDYNKSL